MQLLVLLVASTFPVSFKSYNSILVLGTILLAVAVMTYCLLVEFHGRQFYHLHFLALYSALSCPNQFSHPLKLKLWMKLIS